MAVPTAVPKGSSKPGYADLKWCHTEAYSFLSRALQLDETGKGDKAEALDLYSRGVRELEKGVALEISVEGEEATKAERLRSKMITNLDMARERVAELLSGGELRGKGGGKTSRAPKPTESLRVISVTPREPLKHKKVLNEREGVTYTGQSI